MRQALTASAAALFAVFSTPGPALADAGNAGRSEVTIEQTAADSVEWVLVGLRQSGYRIVSVKSTFLGRIRILAENRTNRREIIVSRTTGDIFRDRIIGPTIGSSGSGPARTSTSGGTKTPATDESSGGNSLNVGVGVGGIDVNVDIGGSSDQDSGGLGGVLNGITDALSGG